MGKTTSSGTDILKLIFNATGWANLADNTASSPAANLTIALHTSSPGVGGNQSTNEISYTGYARLNVVRTSSGWTVSSASCSNVNNMDFGQMSGGAGGTVTHFSIGTGTSNYMIYFGTVTPNISVANGVVPRLTPASTITEA